MLNLLSRVHIVSSGTDMCYVKDHASHISLHGLVYSSISMHINTGTCSGYIHKGYISHAYK